MEEQEFARLKKGLDEVTEMEKRRSEQEQPDLHHLCVNMFIRMAQIDVNEHISYIAKEDIVKRMDIEYFPDDKIGKVTIEWISKEQYDKEAAEMNRLLEEG